MIHILIIKQIYVFIFIYNCYYAWLMLASFNALSKIILSKITHYVFTYCIKLFTFFLHVLGYFDSINVNINNNNHRIS